MKALSDETRLRIYALLGRAELCVCEIEDILGLGQSLVSNHLSVLRRVGLVTARRDERDARWIFYRACTTTASSVREMLDALFDVRPTASNKRRAESVCRLKGRSTRG